MPGNAPRTPGNTSRPPGNVPLSPENASSAPEDASSVTGDAVRPRRAVPVRVSLGRMFTGPPGLMMIPLAAFACACLLYGASAPGGHLTEVGSGILLGLTLAVAWVPRFLAGLLRQEGRPGLLRHRARWAALPAMGAVTAALIGFHVPYDVRFALSEPGLERLAQKMTAGNGPAYHEGWVGLYPVYARRVDGDVIFMVRNTGFLGTHGFAWSPPGGPPHRHEGGYTHLRGPWYEWRADF